MAGETLMLPLLAVGIGIWLNPLDPLWTRAAFPWAWFAPVVLALRYGPFSGLAGASVLFVSWFAFSLSGWSMAEFPKLNFLGGLIMVVLAGEFSSVWLARARRAEGVELYLDQRLEHLTHQYYLLRLSHDRLEQDLIGRPMSMRDALGALHEIADQAQRDEKLPGADRLLRLLAQYCQIEVAALYTVDGDSIADRPAAVIGQAPADLAVGEDPLVRHAIEHASLSHVAAASEEISSSRYIIAAPLASFDGERLALLVVGKIPFFALHDETLQTLNLLLGYYTDGLLAQRLAAEVTAAHPICPPAFAAELQRLCRVQRESNIASVIVALEFRPGAGLDDLATHIRRQRRALDVNWLLDADGRKLVVTLMPLAGEAAAEGYIARIEEWVRQQTGQSIEQAGIFPHTIDVAGDTPHALLDRLFAVCHVATETLPVQPGA